MGDPVRNIYKGRFVAKQKLDAAEDRIALLEAAIRKHREYAWGDGAPVENLEDAFLYAALKEKRE